MQNQRVERLNREPSLERNMLTEVLQALTDPALTPLEANNLSCAILRCLREIMAADNLAILLLTEDHTALYIYNVLGLEETVTDEVHIPLGSGFVGQIIMQGLPLIVHDTSKLETITPGFREQLHSLLGVPLMMHKQVIGVIYIGMEREYLFTDADVALLHHVADYLTHAFERTLLIEAEQQAIDELVEAQLSAVVELVETQQHVATKLVEAQQHVATKLVETQQRVAIELVEAQLNTAVELVEAQLNTAIELIDAQLPTARKLVETQQRIAIELIGTQLPMAEDLVEYQQHTAGDLVKAQKHTAGDLIEYQQHTAGDLVKAQLYAAKELVEAQQHIAIELMRAQQRVAIELIEDQQQIRIKAFEQMNEIDTIFNAIMDGVIVYDEQKNFVHLNRAAHYLRDIYGCTFLPEQLPLKSLLSGERLTAKQAVVMHLHTLDNRDIQLSITGAPLYNQQGHLYGAVCVLRDITTRKHMERRVEILEVLLQMVELLVKSSAQKDPRVIQNEATTPIEQIENNILILAQRLLGCSHAIIIGIHQSTHALSPLVLVGFSAEQEQRLRSVLTDAHLSLLIQDPENIALLEKQESVSLDITQSPLLHHLFQQSTSPNCHIIPIHIAHRLVGLLGIRFPDTTSLPHSERISLTPAISKLCALALQYEQQTIQRDELMAAEVLLNEQLEQVNKMQSDFISTVSHNFRTSLTTIEGFSELLRSGECSSEEVQEYSNDIHTDALRLHQMVADLLDLEQMKKDKMQLHAAQVDMNTLLTTTTKHMEQVSTRHILYLILDKNLPQIQGDPDKLLQIITNLLSNAIKYSPKGGDITIKSWREDKAIRVSIQDHGIGIAPDDIKNIFTPYHRINSASTRYIQGTGLGLSLVREIIHLHEGTIWVESTLGDGSTFHFSLPLSNGGLLR